MTNPDIIAPTLACCGALVPVLSSTPTVHAPSCRHYGHADTLIENLEQAGFTLPEVTFGGGE